MRILLVASWYRTPQSPTRGSFIREQALALADRGHEVHVAHFDRDSTRRLLKIGRRQDGALREHAIATPWPLHRVLGFYFPWPLVRTMRKLIEEIRPDIVHAHTARPAGVIAALAARGRNRPLVLTEHSSPLRSFWWTPHGWWRIASAYRASDRCLAVSEALRMEMQRFFPNTARNCTTLYNGVDTGLFAAKRERVRSYRILFVGALERRKRVDLVLEMLTRLRPEARLTMVGSGPLEATMRTLAVRLGVAERVVWLHRRDRAEVAALMASHDLLVLSSDAETFSLVCAEALACGTPVVATRCGGPEEVVPPFGGIFVPRGDAGALADAVERILAGRFAYDPVALRNYVVENFSMRALAENLELLYRQLIEQYSRRIECAE